MRFAWKRHWSAAAIRRPNGLEETYHRRGEVGDASADAALHLRVVRYFLGGHGRTCYPGGLPLDCAARRKRTTIPCVTRNNSSWWVASRRYQIDGGSGGLVVAASVHRPTSRSTKSKSGTPRSRTTQSPVSSSSTPHGMPYRTRNLQSETACAACLSADEAGNTMRPDSRCTTARFCWLIPTPLRATNQPTPLAQRATASEETAVRLQTDCRRVENTNGLCRRLR